MAVTDNSGVVARLDRALATLRADANSKAAVLFDRTGRRIAAASDAAGLDTSSPAALTGGHVDSGDGQARLIGQGESTVLSPGQQDNIHLSIVAKAALLIVVFDERSSLGLVRLRVKRAAAELETILGDDPGLAPITDEDVQDLFEA
ncbi:roadblock/LC7 domain-containing protein [Kitasatospora sp. NPDC048407]|uniref:roadblock/LC7 domain-containing protein n=1 Tax=Kitasatospora sp. NPDC048407 TaxID=3364051 RepID=UPI00371D17A3